MGDFIIPIFISHQGCPHDCIFCDQEKISGSKRSPISGSQLQQSIELWLSRKSRPGPCQLAFYGGSFTCMGKEEQQRLFAAAKPYLDHGKIASLRLSTRPDCIDPESCQLLLANQVETVELGVQSLDQRVLDLASRGHGRASVIAAAGLLKRYGFTLGIQLMPGLPGDSWTSFSKTLAATIALGPDFVRLYPTLVLKGTGLERLHRQGAYGPLSLTRAVAWCAEATRRLQGAGIKVIRCGLQPGKSLSENLVAGPHHPAFGELVQARLWFLRLRKRLFSLGEKEHLNIHVCHRDLSALVGRKKANLIRLDALGYRGRYTILPDTTRRRGEVDYAVSY